MLFLVLQKHINMTILNFKDKDSFNITALDANVNLKLNFNQSTKLIEKMQYKFNNIDNHIGSLASFNNFMKETYL